MITKEQLDELEILEKKASRSEWSSSRTDMDSFTEDAETGEWNHVAYLYREPDQRAAFFGKHNRSDLALICALRNHAKELIAAARENIELKEELKKSDWQKEEYRKETHRWSKASKIDTQRFKKENQRLREALAGMVASYDVLMRVFPEGIAKDCLKEAFLVGDAIEKAKSALEGK